MKSKRFLVDSLIGFAICLLLIAGCSSRQRTTHTTLASIGKAVDIAEREYLDGVLTKRYKTNGFPEVQRAYGLFQLTYSNAVWVAARDTNGIAVPPEVIGRSKSFLNYVERAKGGAL